MVNLICYKSMNVVIKDVSCKLHQSPKIGEVFHDHGEKIYH